MESAIEMLGGADNLMYASDYLHWNYDELALEIYNVVDDGWIYAEP